MSGLKYSPAQQSQSIRQRIRALRNEDALMVVEGASDRSLMSHLLDDHAHVVYTRGKSTILSICGELAREFPDRILFLVDCDDTLEDVFKGLDFLVITQYRDLDADLILVLDAWSRVAAEAFSHNLGGSMSAREVGRRVLKDCVHVSLKLAKVHGAARRADVPSSVRDSSTNRKRRVRPSDFSDVVEWFADEDNCESIIHSHVQLLGWSPSQVTSIRESISVIRSCPHSPKECTRCAMKRSVNGHNLIDLLNFKLANETGCTKSVSDLLEKLRIGADLILVDSWVVARRIKVWEQRSGRRILRSTSGVPF